MSDHTNRNLLTKPRYLQRHVGGKHRPENNQQYINNQIELIKDGDVNLPPNVRYGQSPYNRNQSQLDILLNRGGNVDSASEAESVFSNQGVPGLKSLSRNLPDSNSNKTKKSNDLYMRHDEDRYDPYEGYLYKNGLMDDGGNRRRFKTVYMSIDSRFRTIRPSLNTGESQTLNRNPLDFNANSNQVFVRNPGHNFEVGSLITMESVFGTTVILRTFNDQGNPTFDIPGGCNVMKVFYTHGLPVSYTGSQLEVEFAEIKGDRGTVQSQSFLGNIPTNVLNSRFSIKVEVTEDDLDPNCDLSDLPPDYLDFSENYFFVILPLVMRNPDDEPPYVLREYNFRISFLYTGGVPLNLLNARYPIDPDHINGFHVITEVRDNGYFFEINSNALIDENGGGNCIRVSEVFEINPGYPNQNNYIIELGRTFHNIVSVRLVSTEFPNSERFVKAFPPERANNKIYWNDIEAGDFLYSIEIPEGNYTPATLEAKMEELFLQVPRVTTGGDFGSTYESNHPIQVDINNETDEVTFSAFRQAILSQPIVAIDPEIFSNPNIGQDDPDVNYTLTINHPEHGIVTPGVTIVMSNAVQYFGIPASILNSQHVVTEILDEDNYRIVLPRFNLLDDRDTDSRGGVAVNVLVPDTFRLRFDQPDTMGGLLGFRNPGDEYSITEYTSVVSNKDEYAFDIDKNVLGETIRLDNNAIQLSGDDYVLMEAKPLETLVSIGPTKSAFAKIQLCDIPGKVLFNSYVSTSRFYEDPLHEVSELEVKFFTPDGFLYDFHGLDHSYTIEFVFVNDIPEGTGISANTGRNYNLST